MYTHCSFDNSISSSVTIKLAVKNSGFALTEKVKIGPFGKLFRSLLALHQLLETCKTVAVLHFEVSKISKYDSKTLT